MTTEEMIHMLGRILGVEPDESYNSLLPSAQPEQNSPTQMSETSDLHSIIQDMGDEG